jgi:hypothetical protein
MRCFGDHSGYAIQIDEASGKIVAIASALGRFSFKAKPLGVKTPEREESG